MNFSFLGYKLLMICGILLFAEGFLFFSIEEIYQVPYIDKKGLVHYKSKTFSIYHHPFGVPHSTRPSEQFKWADEVLVRDYRYRSWLNWWKRLIVYKIIKSNQKIQETEKRS